MHDPWIGRFFAVDPLAPKYPHNSPYAFSENRLLDGVELEGLEVELLNSDGKTEIGPFSQDYIDNTINNGGSVVQSPVGEGPYQEGYSSSTIYGTQNLDAVSASPSRSDIKLEGYFGFVQGNSDAIYDNTIQVAIDIYNNPMSLVTAPYELASMTNGSISASMGLPNPQDVMFGTNYSNTALNNLLQQGHRFGNINNWGGYEFGYFSGEVSVVVGTSVAGAYMSGINATRFEASTPVISVTDDAVVHGNSLSSLKATWGYKLYSNDDVFLKNGITSAKKAESRYSKKFMSDKYMGTKKLFPNRREAYDWEYKQNTIKRGPLNKNMH